MTARYVRPGLTTVRQPVRELGAMAADRLHELVTGALPPGRAPGPAPRSWCCAPPVAARPRRPRRVPTRAPATRTPSEPDHRPCPRRPVPPPEGETTMRRSPAITVATLATAALALSACGRGTGAAASNDQAKDVSSGKATGTITVWAMGAEGEKLPALAKQFESANPGVKVNVTAIPWDAAHDKFTTAITAGKTPDAAMVGTTWMGEFAGSRRPRPDAAVVRQEPVLPRRPEDHRGGRHLLRHPVVRRDAAGLLPHRPGQEGRLHHAAQGLGRPEGHGQGHAGQGRRQVGHRPAGRRHRVVAERHAVRVVQRRRASPRTAARPTASTPRRCTRR